MDPDFLDISNQVYSDLSYLKSLNPLALQYLVSYILGFWRIWFLMKVGEVSRNMVNDEISVKNCSNMDIIGRISVDLENEGIELSNEKIRKILNAIRNLVKQFYKAYIKNV